MSIETKECNNEFVPVANSSDITGSNVKNSQLKWNEKIPFNELSSLITTYNKYSKNKLSFDCIYSQGLLLHKSKTNLQINFTIMEKVIKLHCDILFLHCKNLSEQFDKIGWDIRIDKETNEHLAKIYEFQSKYRNKDTTMIENDPEFLYLLHQIQNDFKSIWLTLKEMSMLLDIKTIQGVKEIPWK